MVLSKKLKKDESPISLESLILKGGTSGIDKIEPENLDNVKKVQLRVPLIKLNQIDELVAKRPGNLARHTWIMEAIEEKLKRDRTAD